MSGLFFSPDGRARYPATCVLVLVLTLCVSFRRPDGWLEYKSDAVLAILVPIAGTLVALALPAAQLGQSVIERLLSDAENLIRSDRPIHDIADYLEKFAHEQKRNLEAIRCVIVYSVASFGVGLLGTLGLMGSVKLIDPSLAARDVLSSLSMSLLVVAVAWMLPVVWSSFNYSKAEQLVALLKKTPATTPPPPPPQPANPGGGSATATVGGKAV
jgi:hypothetical protein